MKGQTYFIKTKAPNVSPTQVQDILNKMSSRNMDSLSQRMKKTPIKSQPSSPKVPIHQLLSQSKHSIRISNHDASNGEFFMHDLLETEARRREILIFKQNMEIELGKITTVENLELQIGMVEKQLEMTLKKLQILKQQLVKNISESQQSIQIAIIRESLQKMQNDIILNEENIVNNMKMKPFRNIMSIYNTRIAEHSKEIDIVFKNQQQLVSLNEQCDSLLKRVIPLADTGISFGQLINNKENLRSAINTQRGAKETSFHESPCFKQ